MQIGSKWIIASLVLLVAVLASTTILFSRSQSRKLTLTVEDTHTVNKSLDHDGTRWVELKTKSENGLHELWRIQGKDSSLVNTFSLSPFSHLDWQIDEDGNIHVSHWDGGPEGGDATEYIYDQLGNELTRITQKNLPFDGGTFTFGVNPSYRVKYLTQTSCQTQKPVNDQGAHAAPSIELDGLSISYGNDKKRDYLLQKPVSLGCIPSDGAFIDPTIAIIYFKKDMVEIRLTDNVMATISKTHNAYGTPLAPTVTFKP